MSKFTKVLRCGLALVLVSVMLSQVYMNEAFALDDPVVSDIEAAYVYNVENDQTLFKYNETEQLYPAATVKIMTAILAIEKFEDNMDEVVTITSDMLENVSGYNIDLQAGEEISVKDLIAAMVINSANDAAYALAYAVSGSLDKFISLMNTTAANYNALDTHYTNPTGMHDYSMVTTVNDTAIIAKKAYSLSVYRELVGSTKYTIEATNLSEYRTLYNRNCLLSMYYETGYYYEKATGMNAGSTPTAGQSLVASATDGDETYIVICMGGETNDSNEITTYTNAINLFEWAFDSYGSVEILSASKMVCEIPVELSQTVDHATLVSKDALYVYLAKDVDVDTAIEYKYITNSDVLTAPLSAGDVVGEVQAFYGDDLIGTSDLIVTTDIPRSDILYYLSKIEEFVKSTFFISFIIVAAVLSVLFVLINARYKKKHPHWQ